MISLKDLENRVYSGRDCVRFEYNFKADEKTEICARFKKLPDGNAWSTQIVLERTRDKDSEVYNFSYTLPKYNMPLELIAAIGLRYFQLYLKEEVQLKSSMDFIIGDIVAGVLG